MAILSVTEFRGHVETNLGDDEVQRLLDAAEETILEAVGAPDSATEYLRASGDLLMLSRPAESITSVVEAATWTLDPLDYQLRPSGTILHRLRTGPNPSVHWRGRVEVAYVPADDAARRAVAQVELCRVEIAFNPGLASQTIGQWTEAYQSSGQTPEQMRSSALQTLLDPAGVW